MFSGRKSVLTINSGGEQQQRINQNNIQLAKKITASWELPKREAESLASIVAALSVPVKSKTRIPVVIGPVHKLTVSLDIDKSLLSQQRVNKRLSLIREIFAAFRQSSIWQQTNGSGLVFQTVRSFPFLASNKSHFSSGILNHIGMTALPKSKILQACYTALVHHANTRNGNIKFRQMVALTKDLKAEPSDPNGRKLIQFANKPKKGALVYLDYDELEEALNVIVPFVEKAVKETKARTTLALNNLYTYFGDDGIQVSDKVVENLEKVLDFLSVPDASKFRHYSELDKRFDLKKIREDTLALEHNRVLYFVPDNIALYGTSTLQNTILHEVLHIFIIERHQRGRKVIEKVRDPAYSYEEHFWELETQVALENPDSYVEFVRGF